MKKIFAFLVFLAFGVCGAEELVSIEDSKRLLSTDKKSWTQQVDIAVKSGAARKVYWQDELGMSVLVGDAHLSVIPNYGNSSSLPIFLSVNFSYPPNNPVAKSSDAVANSICKKIVTELKSQFSVLCSQSSKNGWRKFYVVTSIPGKYPVADNLNASGNYFIDIDKNNIEITKYSDLLLEKYWSEIEEWVSSTSNTQLQNIEFAGKKIPELCGRLATIYSLKSGISVEENNNFTMDVDVCAKTMIHRKFPQPEFDNPKIVRLICNSKLELYKEVCRRGKLK